MSDSIGDAQVFDKDFLMRVGMGLVPGWTFVEKFGENPDIDTADLFEHVWDGAIDYVPPTEARIHDVASDNIADAGTVISSGTATGGTVYTLIDTGATFQTDGVAIGDKVLNDSKCTWGTISSVDSETQITIVFGMRYPSNGLIDGPFEAGDSYRIFRDASTGASCIWIQGLDANRLPSDEFVILNGTTNVPTLKSYFRQFRARIFTTGNTGAIGTVTSTAQTDGTVTLQVVDGNNQTLMAIYSVPINVEAFIIKWWGGISKKVTAQSTIRMRVGLLDQVGYIQQTRAVSSSGKSDFEYKFEIPLRVTGGVDIWIEADASTNDVGISGGFTILMKDSSLAVDPSVVPCPAGQWTKVADNVTGGKLNIQDLDKNIDVAYYTYVAAGSTAPTLEPGDSGNKSIVISKQSMAIESDQPVDVYFYPSKEAINVVFEP
jgi:hypothetical protein